MTNALKGEVSLPLGGETFTLVFDVDALCAAEDALDLSVEDIIAGLNRKKPRLGFVRGVLWAGLRRHRPDLTLEAVGQRFLGPGGIGAAVALVYIADALAKAFPPPAATSEAASGEADPPQAEAGTGNGSSASGASTS